MRRPEVREQPGTGPVGKPPARLAARIAGSPARARVLPLTGRIVLGVLVLFALVLNSLVASPAARAAAPRVAIIVGPVGSLTPAFRAVAAEGAAAARAAGAEVVEVITPNATWPAARAAMQGASIVIYVGHGNGFPSRYSTVLKRETQNGLGLNPVAGVDNEAHRYFGEAYIAREVRLAPNAIVLLHRLCYASGNAEPGLPEGSLADSRARADNFAAGFLAAGASAVVADTFASPRYYVHEILAHNRSIESIWRSSPTFHGHVQTMASTRTTGATELLDPTRPTSGFYRSLVGRLNVRGQDVRSAGQGGHGMPAVPPAHSGPSVDALRLAGRPVAGTQVELRVHLVTGKDLVAPAALGVGSRWTPLDLSPGTVSTDPSPAPVTSASPHPSPTPGTSASPHPSPPPVASASPHSSPTATPSPDIWSSSDPTALAAEEPSAVTVAAMATKDGDAFRVALEVPERPGFYRLTISLLDASGAAYDAATQAEIPAMLVHVIPALSAAIEAPVDSTLPAREPFEIELVVTNTGSIEWGPPPEAGKPGSVASVEVIGRWNTLAAEGAAQYTARAWFIPPAAGASAIAVLSGTTPGVPGNYLVSIDLVTPAQGSLTFAGALEPVVVRVTVVRPPGSCQLACPN